MNNLHRHQKVGGEYASSPMLTEQRILVGYNGLYIDKVTSQFSYKSQPYSFCIRSFQNKLPSTQHSWVFEKIENYLVRFRKENYLVRFLEKIEKYLVRFRK